MQINPTPTKDPLISTANIPLNHTADIVQDLLFWIHPHLPSNIHIYCSSSQWLYECISGTQENDILFYPWKIYDRWIFRNWLSSQEYTLSMHLQVPLSFLSKSQSGLSNFIHLDKKHNSNLNLYINSSMNSPTICNLCKVEIQEKQSIPSIQAISNPPLIYVPSHL